MSKGKYTIAAGLLVGLATSALVFLAVCVGHEVLFSPNPWGTWDCYARYDGQHYKHIVAGGYTYSATHSSEVAFFPVFPLLGRLVMTLTGLGPVGSLLLAANGALAGACVAFAYYASARAEALSGTGCADHVRPVAAKSNATLGTDLKSGAAESQTAPPDVTARASESRTTIAGRPKRGPPQHVFWCAMLAFGLWPTTMFFRMTYSESTFLAVAILALFGMERKWPLLGIAVLVGLGTATRPVGVALVCPFLLCLWRRSSSRSEFVRRLFVFGPLAVGGLLAYMLFQQIEFHNPIAFAQTQEHWNMRPPELKSEKWESLLCWEPIWSVYDPGGVGCWQRFENYLPWYLSLIFANPIYFVGAAGLTAWGCYRQLLTGYEMLLCVSLLAIPYVTRGFEMCMASQGRFAAVVFPLYLLLGRGLARLPRAVAGLVFLAMAGWLVAYAALFGCGYLLF
ncbi:MAG TPA: hypothetical protein VFE24_16175 [Pirellulales bacterium]|nr:hypothetical protein [Pirellulales bacterium]